MVLSVLIHSLLVLLRNQQLFRTGQPLGYYGSWGLFALSHHFIVWLAAELAKPGRRPFTKYALLGDDIVISDKTVAIVYQQLLESLGVSISLGKDWISSYGAFEFAKQFWVKGINLSPISAKSLLAADTLIGLCQYANK